MGETSNMELFQNLFYVSTAVAIMGLGLSVFFFFYFDIRNVYALMTGKAKRQTIERMAEQNAKTGHLRSTTANIRDTQTPRIQHPSKPVTAEVQPMAQMSREQFCDETTILSDCNETTVLKQEPSNIDDVCEEAGATTILAPSNPIQSDIRFDITESTMVINTDEIL